MKKLIALIVLPCLLACGVPRIDGRDAEHARTSIGRVRASVSPADEKPFEDGLRLLMLRAAPLPSLSDPKVRAAIDGKSGREIIEAAARLRKSMEEERRAEMVRRDELERMSVEKNVAPAEIATPAPPGSYLQSLATNETTARMLVESTAPKDPVPNPDPDVKANCAQYQSDTRTYNACLVAETDGKKAMTGPIPNQVPVEVAERIRANCRAKYPDSYRLQGACQRSDVLSIANVGAHPEVMKTLSAVRQAELKRLMGQ